MRKKRNILFIVLTCFIIIFSFASLKADSGWDSDYDSSSDFGGGYSSDYDSDGYYSGDLDSSSSLMIICFIIWLVIIVILTSNSQRSLLDETKDRCLFLYIPYPTVEREIEIAFDLNNLI